MAARSRSAPSMSRCRRCRLIPPTGTGNSTTTPAKYLEQLFAADLVEVETARRQVSVLCRRLAALRCHPRRTRRELEVEAGSAPPRDPPAQGRHVSGQARRDGVARTGRRRRRFQPTIASRRARRRSPAISIMSTRSKPPTRIRSCSPSRPTTPNGIIASAGATTPPSIPKEVADAGAANWKNVNGTGPFMLERLRAGQFQHLRQEPELLGQREDRRRRDTSCLWSTRSSIAPSRMRRPS